MRRRHFKYFKGHLSQLFFLGGGGGGHFKYVKVYVTVYQVENANVSTILMHITYRFLKRAPHEGANLLSIDTVPCDGHQMTSTRHDVTKQSQVTVIDIRAIK